MVVFSEKGSISCSETEYYQTGKGLWVYVDAPLTVSAPTESSNSSITVNLVSGWNLIGNPYGSDIKKSDVVFLIDGEPFINSVDVRHELYSFDALSNTYTQADVLKPGMAYWVFVNNPSVLTFFAEKPKDPNPAVPGTPLAEDKDDLGNPFAKGEMIIQLIDEKDGQFQTVLTQINGTALSESKALGLYRIKVNNTKNAFRLINSYKNYWAQSNPPIKVVASLNYLLKASAYAPDDPPYQTGGDKTQVWGFEKIKAPEVWKTFTPKSAPVVAVIDTGVSGTHAELAGRLVGGANFLYGDASAPDSDANGHGTQIAGLIAAQQDNGKGISGVCFDCKIMPVKVCDNSGNCPLFSVLNGIVYAADNSAGVINISLSGGIAADQIDNITKIFATVVDYAKNKNALVVAAAGNANASAANYVPGAVAGVLSVGATDQNDQSTDFTNYGPSVVISAPGFSIYSTNIPDNYSFGSGTSLSAALVSGAAGVLRSAVPTLSVDQMKQILISTADVISTSKQIGPRLNLRKAMEFIVPMTPQFEIISLTPASVMANPGEVVELAVQTTIAGNTGVVFNWTVTGGTLLDKGAGNVSWTAPATQEDYTITVEAVSPYGYKDTASSMAKVLAVSLPVATTISVSPAFITLDVGMQQFFTAEVKDQYNNPITAALKWSYDNNTATVTANGMLTALQAGQGELTVSTANGLSATATVFVIDNTPPINPAACGGGCTCCVTNNDGGTIAGSLRACLTFANGNAGHDNICLDPLLGNGVTVSPTAAIANITDQAGVTLDFTGRDFRLDGTSAVVGDGLYIRSSNNIVRGIQFVKFDGGPGNYAITIDGAVGATGNIIAGNTFGTYTGDPAGVAQRNNGGIQLRGGASNNTIGGNTPADRNLFVNNQTSSIDINSANNNIIQGNYFGVNRTGTGAFPSADRVNRIRVRNTSSGNIIGGDSTAGEGNLISGSNGYGIELNGGSVIGTLIRGNIIGADLTGTVSVPNVSGGILIVGNANNSIVGGAAGTNFGNLISGNSSHGIYINNAWSSNNVIIGNKIGTKIDGITALANNGWGVNIIANANIVGTTAAGEGNIIAYNTSGGVTVNASINDKVSGNSMFLNGGLAIDLVGGANNNIAAPNITGFVATAWNVYTVTGTVTMANANVEIYRVNNAAAPVVGQDPTNRGELFQLICTTDAVGLNFTASNCNVAVGDYISGISRNTANNDTSEAGLNRQITNIAPVANAGLDQTFNSPGSLVTLDGSASSDGNYDTLTYAWTQTAGPVIALSDSAAVGPTFTPAVCGNYTFRLIVNDSHVNSAADFVNVTVNCVPVANAGLDQFLDSPGLLVTLDGSASSDANGDPLTYAWTQTGGVAVVLSSNTAQKPTFTPATCGDYTFSLVVNDTHIDSAADSVVITVNCVPVANAGPDQLVIQPGVLVTLDGSASADADGDPLTYAWTQTGGAAVVLSNSAAVGPTFTPATCGNYTFSLTVNDTHINSAADSVAVRINCVPVANAGPDQLINQPGVLVTLDGSASADADGDPLTYAWTQTGGAAVVLSSNTAQKPTFTPVTCGNYSFSLVVNDTNINSPADSVAIRINCAPVANAGPDQTPPAPGALVTLDGSASADADGDPLTYAWTQTGGVAVVLSNAAAQMPTFTPATCGNYVFSLVVNDTHIDSAADSVTISVNCVPVANAGPDQFKIQPGVLVTLDGSASSDANLDPLTYAWTQSAGPAVVLSDSTLVNPTFTPALPGTYTFSLIVNDGLINSAADTVTITVNAVPVANAGPDQAIPSPAVLVTLDGSGSSDADSDPLTYAWSQTGGPAVVALSDPTAQNPTFTPPVAGSYTFQLIVNDGHINSAADVVVIATNAPPVADAGPDQLVIQNGILITLDGSASSDANLDPLTYSWTQTSGTAVVLSSNTAQQPTFTPALCGSYIFSLVVNDGQINSVADSVTIHVNCVPVANAGPDQLIIQPGILVTLDGSASSDANFDPLTYAWTQTSGPAVILSNATLVNPTFTPALPGSYTFSLIVNDGHINSVASVVTITVNTVPVANAGPDQAPPAPGALVTLDGSASADADGDPLTYAWTQTGGAAVVLSSNTAQKPTFTPATCGNYDFSLVVNDTHINSAADSVSIKVNCVPVANAGPDQFINQPAILVTLDGSASSDANLDPLTYAWTQTAGPAVVLSNPAAVGPTFTPATPGVYTFNLIVNDGIINSAADTVTITVNTVPVANAGPDQLVIQPGVLVTLDGSASSDADGDPITYAWTQTSGAAVVLSSNTAQKPTFTPASCGNYTFSLVVNDSHINSAADTVAIRINCVPVANAGPDQAPPAPGALVTLDGSASSDADGDPLTYAWTQTGGAVVVLSSNTAQKPTFTPAVCGNYDFSLIVNDTNINSAADSVTIKVNCVPIANAGPDQFINQPGVLVTLDGSASSDANLDPLTYAWTQTAGPVVVLSNPAAAGPTFTPALPGVYTFSLIVNDGIINSAADTVTITVNTVPVANAGPDQLVIQPAVLVTLDGSASADADGDPITYAWTQTGGAAVVLSSNTAQKPTFTPATCGNYTFSLVVNDSHINSSADSVAIRINCVPVANAGPDQLIIQPSVLVTLDGSASSDADGDPLTYAWTQTGGAAVVLSNPAAAGPTFTPAAPGIYTFSLIVNDSHINSSADTVVITVNTVPVANAGPDQLIIQPSVLVTLDGSASSDADGDPLTYAWAQTGGAAVVLSSNTAQKPTFTPATCGNYTFSLVVNDSHINSAADSVAIRINCVPVANAGPDQAPPAPGALVTLDGSASSDADGDPLTYAWTQTGGAAVVLSSNTAQKPTFTPATCGNYDFSLIVNDTHINSAADSVTIKVNCVPVANAGPDQFINQPAILVTLDGSASSDANLDPLTYAWTQTAGPAV
ncbi:MAG: PKD domain-containing protein, partial [bacterium]